MFDIGGATAVKHHPFFEGIDWAKLILLQMEPPLKPELVSTTDTSNFSAEFVEMSLPRSLSQESLLSHSETLGPPSDADEVGAMFRGFSFVADSFIDSETWTGGRESDNFSFGEGIRTTSQKKVKGKRIRNKKGKTKDGQPDGTASAHPNRTGIKQGVVDNLCVTTHDEQDRLPDTSRASTIPLRPFEEMILREPVKAVESKRSGLAVMLAEQKDTPTNHKASPAAGRPNVWGVRELPAPAPVPTPAGPPRVRGRHAVEGGTNALDRRPTVKGTNGRPGRRVGGSGSVWGPPV